MKKTSALFSVPILLLALVLTMPCVAQQDAMSPETQLLQVLDGDFDLVVTAGGEEITGTLSIHPIGDGSFVAWDEVGMTNTPNPLHVKGLIGYDAERETFIWRRVGAGGFHDSGQGWLTDKTLTFVMQDGNWPGFPDLMDGGQLIRLKWIDISADGWSGVWETSAPGEGWETYAEFELTPRK